MVSIVILGLKDEFQVRLIAAKMNETPRPQWGARKLALDPGQAQVMGLWGYAHQRRRSQGGGDRDDRSPQLVGRRRSLVGAEG
jgi:hypothetical protein